MQHLPINSSALGMLYKHAQPEGTGDRVRLLWSDDDGVTIVSTEFPSHEARGVLCLLTASMLRDLFDEARADSDSESAEYVT